MSALPSSTRRPGPVGDFFDPARKDITPEQHYAEHKQRMHAFTPVGVDPIAWQAAKDAPPDLLPALNQARGFSPVAQHGGTMTDRPTQYRLRRIGRDEYLDASANPTDVPAEAQLFPAATAAVLFAMEHLDEPRLWRWEPVVAPEPAAEAAAAA
jgi:hypothetical protein